MKLEEAIENTKNRIKSWENIAETGKCCLSNEEYESSQKVCDEENMIIQELERLQKENEELRLFKNEVREIRKDYPSLDMDDCVNEE